MKKVITVDEYIENNSNWSEELKDLRKIVLSTEVKETIKWGAPIYTLDNKNIIGIGAFKTHIGLWFFNGALLKDSKKVLINAQEGKTQAMRQWRFRKQEKFNETLITNYINEAIENQKHGKVVKIEKKPLIIPEEIKNEFSKNQILEEKFNALSLSKKREYADHIFSAKRESTKTSRLNKILPMILNGIGLHDKYRDK